MSKFLEWALLMLLVGFLCQTALSQPSTLFARKPPIMGTLLSVENKNLLVKPRQRGADSQEVTVPTDEKTEVYIDSTRSKLGDLKPGMSVTVSTRQSSPTNSYLVVTAATKTLNGEIVKIEDNTLVIRTVGEGKTNDVTLLADGQTQIKFLPKVAGSRLMPPRDGQLRDLKPGMMVKVSPETGTAQKIYVSSLWKEKAQEHTTTNGPALH
jgi:hypothetical protein